MQTPRRDRAPAPLAAILVLAAAGAAACEPDRTDARTWQASDHDQPPGAASAAPPRPTSDAGSVIELAWRKNCATCHGPGGRGDGPQGSMVGAPDLTRSELLGARTDAELATAIREGKNRMPAFDLPPAIVDGLVARLRAQGSK